MSSEALTEPAVSVIIPTYQRRDLVRQAVDSVLAQTFADFELIVVDDGSTDGTREALAAVDPRLRYHRQNNRGVSAARNAALGLARGEVVAFLDSDNRWRPDHLDVVTSALAQFPEAVLVSTCPGRRVAGSTPVERATIVDLLPEVLLRPRLGYVSCVAVRRDALLTIGGFDERLPVFEDSDLWRRLAALGRVCLLPRRTIEHRVTRGGLRERGIRNGDYLRAIGLSASAAREQVRGLQRPDTQDLLSRANARVELVEAVRALVRADEPAARRAYANACRSLPALSGDPAVVVGLLRSIASEPVELLPLVSASARLWPHQGSDTARYLFAYAAVLCLRTGRPLAAARSLDGTGLLMRPAFAVRTLPLTIRLIRLWTHRLGASA